MNNNIQEDYCSFEVSKLLKDKGLLPYTMFGFVTTFYEPKSQSVRHYGRTGKTSLNKLIYRPTHSVAIKWIRENFGIHISIFPSAITNTEIGDLKGCDTYYARIDNLWNLAHSNDGKNIPYKDYIAYTKYNSWEEATEAALLYTLKNLIK